MTRSLLVAAFVSALNTLPLDPRMADLQSQVPREDRGESSVEEDRDLQEDAELQAFFFGDWTMDRG